MIANIFDYAYGEIVLSEGGFSNFAWDNGGATNKGITIKTYTDWRRIKHGIINTTIDDLKNATDDEIKSIYKEWYWLAASCDKVPQAIALLLFDGAVLSSPARSIKWLQAAVKANQDGIFGQSTLTKLNAAKVIDVIKDMEAERILFFTGHEDFKIAGRGWIRRVLLRTMQAILIHEEINVSHS